MMSLGCRLYVSRHALRRRPVLCHQLRLSSTTNSNATNNTTSSMSAGTPGKVRVNVTTAEGRSVSFAAPVGVTLMEGLRDIGKVDIEAACDGTCACSTCHVILRAEDFAKLAPPSEDEMDMLDLAPSVTKTSRLACQVQLMGELDGMAVQMPPETSNLLS